jgi:hypothetical protein
MDHFPKIETEHICNRKQQNKGYKCDKNCTATLNEVFAEEMKVAVVVDSKLELANFQVHLKDQRNHQLVQDFVQLHLQKFYVDQLLLAVNE